MKVKLTNVYRDHITGGLRTTCVEGECEDIPVIGKSFRMFASSLAAEGVLRYIETTRIVEMDIMDNIITITTENNSIYTVEVLDE